MLGLCGAAYRPTEEIDLRSVGWGNIFQLPFKHVRDFRLRHLVPFFIYSGFEVLFACTGFALVSLAKLEFQTHGTWVYKYVQGYPALFPSQPGLSSGQMLVDQGWCWAPQARGAFPLFLFLLLTPLPFTLNETFFSFCS